MEIYLNQQTCSGKSFRWVWINEVKPCFNWFIKFLFCIWCNIRKVFFCIFRFVDRILIQLSLFPYQNLNISFPCQAYPSDGRLNNLVFFLDDVTKILFFCSRLIRPPEGWIPVWHSFSTTCYLLWIVVLSWDVSQVIYER